MEFSVVNSELIDFIKRCGAKGTITVTPTKKVDKYLFRSFYMEAKEDYLEVKALDSESGDMYGWHKLKNVDVEEEGLFAVTSISLLLDLLTSIPHKRKIMFTYREGEPLTIMTADEGAFKGFEVDQSFTLAPDEIIEYESNVLAFIGVHEFTEEGIPQGHPNENKYPYDTVVKLFKRELESITNSSIKLTKDQNIRIVMAENQIAFSSGKENAIIKSKDVLKKDILNPIEFDQLFNNLQPIVPQMSTNISLFMRLAGSDNKVKYWMQCKDGNIELNFISGAI